MNLFQRLRRWTEPAAVEPSPQRDAHPLASRRAITDFLFLDDPPEPVDLCFVLGCPTPTNMDPAIAMHVGGLAPLIMVSGHGPAPQPVPEAVIFRDYAVARGIDPATILLETEATNTRDNFAFSAPIIDARIGWARIRSVALVCKPYHARRALMTARRHWPAHLRLVMRPSQEPDDIRAEDWWQTEGGRGYVLRELRAIGTYALQGDLGGF